MRKILTILTVSVVLLVSTMVAPAYSSVRRPNAKIALARVLRNPKGRDAFRRWIRAYYLHKYLEAISRAYPHGLCGRDLPPCWIMNRESGGNIYAVNPGHRGEPFGDPGDPWNHASGKWQFMPSTWAHFRGYPYAAAAPESVQDAKARLVWAGGAGAGHWACC